MIEPFLLLLVVGGVGAYTLAGRSRAHGRFKPVLDEVARKLGGRASPATMFDSPELRAEIGGSTVTLRLQDIHKAATRGTAVAEAALAEGTPPLRLYFGWDIDVIRPELLYIPEVPVPRAFAVSGRVITRADDPSVAARFADEAVTHLADVRREAEARAIEVLVRGGSLRLAVHGIQASPFMVERIVLACAHLARAAARAAKPGAAPEEAPSPRAAPLGDEPCGLCAERPKPGERWERCGKCRTPYHHDCVRSATGCLTPGCGDARTVPM